MRSHRRVLVGNGGLSAGGLLGYTRLRDGRWRLVGLRLGLGRSVHRRLRGFGGGLLVGLRSVSSYSEVLEDIVRLNDVLRFVLRFIGLRRQRGVSTVAGHKRNIAYAAKRV